MAGWLNGWLAQWLVGSMAGWQDSPKMEKRRKIFRPCQLPVTRLPCSPLSILPLLLLAFGFWILAPCFSPLRTKN